MHANNCSMIGSRCLLFRDNAEVAHSKLNSGNAIGKSLPSPACRQRLCLPVSDVAQGVVIIQGSGTVPQAISCSLLFSKRFCWSISVCTPNIRTGLPRLSLERKTTPGMNPFQSPSALSWRNLTTEARRVCQHAVDNTGALAPDHQVAVLPAIGIWFRLGKQKRLWGIALEIPGGKRRSDRRK